MRAPAVLLVLGLFAYSSAEDVFSGLRLGSFSDDTSVAAEKVGLSLGSDLYDIGLQRCHTVGCCRRTMDCCGAFCCKNGRQAGMQVPCQKEMGHPAPIDQPTDAEIGPEHFNSFAHNYDTINF